MPEIKVVNTNDLQKKDIPNPDRCNWHELSLFALTFDPEAEDQEKKAGKPWDLGEITNESTLFELRSHLYFEQRRWNHFHENPDRETMQNLRIILQKIKELAK